MALLKLDLPDAILDPADLPGALAQMRSAQAAIDRLAEQAIVFSLAELFNERPELDFFSFSLSRETDYDGNSHLSPRIHCAVIAAAPPPEADFDATRDAAWHWVDARTDDWKYAMKGKTFTRPQNPDLLIESLMSECLSPMAFASWQASSLRHAAKDAPPRAPRSI